MTELRRDATKPHNGRQDKSRDHLTRSSKECGGCGLGSSGGRGTLLSVFRVMQGKPKGPLRLELGILLYCLVSVLRKNTAEGFPAEFASIEPYLAPLIRDGILGLTQLIESPVQNVPPKMTFCLSTPAMWCRWIVT